MRTFDEVAAITHVGRVRPQNEDALLMRRDLRLYLVADGMGGHAAGEVASAMAAEGMRGWRAGVPLRRIRSHQPDHQQLVTMALDEHIRALSREIYLAGEDDPKCEGMGTTLCGMVLLQRYAFIFHVGDSRVYRLRGGELVQLTRDHSLVNKLLDAGRPDLAEIATRSAITRALGVLREVEPDILVEELEPGDRFLICTDGLSDEVLDDWMHALLVQHEEPLTVVQNLLVVALAMGGQDNITAMVVDPAT